MMLQIAICDDEPFLRDEVQNLLSAYFQQCGVPFQIDCFASGRALLASPNLFDCIFLDIQMEPPDGLETARQLRIRGFDGLLVYLTVLKESVFDSFETQPFDYLLKPVNAEQFHRTLDRAVNFLMRAAPRELVIQKSGVFQVVRFSEIIYCEVLGRKIFLHQKNGEVLDYYDRMAALEQRVDCRFFRCHRSYLVNLDHVRSSTKGLAAMLDGSTVPVARSREQALAQALLSRMRERQI